MRVFEINELIDAEENIAITKHLHTEPEPLHSHKFLEIAYVYCGSGYQVINDKQIAVKHGDLMFFFQKDKHSFYPNEQLGIYNCLISPQFLSKYFTNSMNAADILTMTSFSAFTIDNIDTVLHFDSYRSIENLFEEMEQEFVKKEMNYISILHNYLDILLTKIFRKQSSENIDIPAEIHKISPEILRYIEEHYNQKITLTKLAQMSFYSPSYFSRIFKECFNTTLTDFITGLRVQKSIELLKNNGNMSIDSIAAAVGFSDKKSFYAAFKKITGTTPKKLRDD